MNDEQRGMDELFKSLLAERENESKRFWTIFNLMVLINSGLFALVATVGLDTPLPILAAYVGVVLCLLWYATLRRIWGWLEVWEGKLTELEPVYFEELRQAGHPLPTGFQLFVGRKDLVTAGESTRRVGAVLVPVLFGVTWLAIFAVTISSGY